MNSENHPTKYITLRTTSRRRFESGHQLHEKLRFLQRDRSFSPFLNAARQRLLLFLPFWIMLKVKNDKEKIMNRKRMLPRGRQADGDGGRRK
ncbi:MAG: hypothetical protein E7422_07555 [Ruminococcaceae bacterium]|nr:hypothetical protein [Oscillospiraceae bacterium]